MSVRKRALWLISALVWDFGPALTSLGPLVNPGPTSDIFIFKIWKILEIFFLAVKVWLHYADAFEHQFHLLHIMSFEESIRIARPEIRNLCVILTPHHHFRRHSCRGHPCVTDADLWCAAWVKLTFIHIHSSSLVSMDTHQFKSTIPPRHPPLFSFPSLFRRLFYSLLVLWLAHSLLPTQTFWRLFISSAHVCLNGEL